MVDKYFVCVDCNNEFCWTSGEQEFLQECFEKQTVNPMNGSVVKEVVPPKRCIECRIKRKESYANYKKLHSHDK